jgi:hypothetical protein
LDGDSDGILDGSLEGILDGSLGSVPLIIHPINGGVNFLMDSTFRQMDWNNMTTTSSKDEKMKVWILVGGNNLRN